MSNKLQPPVLVLAGLCALSLTACQYAGDRGLDFLDQYRIAVGAGTAVGVRGKSLGVVDTGVMMGVKPKATALGWMYGRPLSFDGQDARFNVDQAEIIKTTSIVGLDYADGSYVSAQNSFALAPGVFTWADSTPTDIDWYVPETGDDFRDRSWLWSGESFERNRYAQIHAFDIEAEVALGVYLDMGFSPGELVDFLLGIVTIDIAEDDGRF